MPQTLVKVGINPRFTRTECRRDLGSKLPHDFIVASMQVLIMIVTNAPLHLASAVPDGIRYGKNTYIASADRPFNQTKQPTHCA